MSFRAFSVRESIGQEDNGKKIRITGGDDEYLTELKLQVHQRLSQIASVRDEGGMIIFKAPFGYVAMNVFPKWEYGGKTSDRGEVEVFFSPIEDFGMLYLKNHSARELCLNVLDRLTGDMKTDVDTMVDLLLEISKIILNPKNYLDAIITFIGAVNMTLSDIINGYSEKDYDLFSALLKHGATYEQLFENEEEIRRFKEDSRSSKSTKLFGI